MSDAHVFDIGKHCDLPTCHALDFTPHVCPHCHLTFCSAHSFPDSHACHHDPAHHTSAPPASAITNGNSASSAAVIPPKDSERRLADDTARQAQRATAQTKRDAARALLEKNFGRSAPVATIAQTRTKTGASGKAKGKKNAVVELMRLKQRAVPLEGGARGREVPMADRLFVACVCLEAGRSERREFWFNKSITVGKLTDLLAVSFGVRNANNDMNTPTEQLLKVRLKDSDEALNPSQKSNEAIDSGSTIVFGQAQLLKQAAPTP